MSKEFVIGISSFVNVEHRVLLGFLRSSFSDYKWTIRDGISDYESLSKSESNRIDFLLLPYPDFINRPLTKKNLLATTFPKCKSKEFILGEGGFVFVFLRRRMDIMGSFSSYFGKVYFVGAGAGNKELLSIRGMKRLNICNIVIYDHLLDKEILNSYVGYDTKLLALTKYGARTQKNLVSQDEINEAILRYSLLLEHVVRLKGGDPFVFGRGAEECEYLLPFNITYEIVPGISSMLSALSYSGIPLTHRYYNDGFIAITGYRKSCISDDSLCNKNIAKKINFALENKLMVVLFMSLNNWSNFVDLIEEQEAPVAFIESGGYPSQRTSVTSVKGASGIIKKMQFRSPTLITIGSNIDARLEWFEKLPLYNRRILCFSSPKLRNELYDVFSYLGANIKLTELYNLISADLNYISSCLATISTYDYIIITSRNAFDFLISSIKELHIDIRTLPKIIVSGEKTKSEFQKIGIIPDIVPDTFSTEGIIKELQSINNISEKRFLFPKSSLTDGSISKFLKEKDAYIFDFVLYQNKERNIDTELIEEIVSFKPNYIIFTSSGSVDIFAKKIYKKDMQFVAIPMGSKTMRTLEKHNLSSSLLEPKHFTIEGIKDALLENIPQNII